MTKKNENIQIKHQKMSGNKVKKNFCKQLMKFVFSHIGLVLIILIWSLLGGFLFRLLETYNEKIDCIEGKGEDDKKLVNLATDLLTYIQFNITTLPNDNQTLKIQEMLMEYRDYFYDQSQKYSYYGQNCNDTTNWEFVQALFFSIQAITTIGYGNISPKTWEGQVVCICYSVIGIPFVLMCIANISGVLGDMFRYVYSRICCRLCIKKKQPNQLVLNQYDYDLATARPNDVTPVWGPDSDINQKPPFNNDRNPRIGGDPPLGNESDKVAVPLTVTMLIILAYLGVGAVIYMLTEEWKFVESIYFCFITLSTIGFGDFVPGQKANDTDTVWKMIGGFCYILVGMAIIAMSFDLMQDEIISKFTWLGTKMGMTDPPVEPSNHNSNEFENIESISNTYRYNSCSSDGPQSTRINSKKSEMMSKTRPAHLPYEEYNQQKI